MTVLQKSVLIYDIFAIRIIITRMVTTMLSAYPAYIKSKEDSTCNIIFPDIKQLSIQGDTLQAALENAIDILACYLYSLKIENKRYPEPSRLDDCTVGKGSDAGEKTFINLITVDVEEYARAHLNRAVKKTLTIPKWLNDLAVSRGVKFSQVLYNGLMNELQLSKSNGVI